MQTCIGKFFGRVDSAKKGELHSFLFEKEHSERGKRLREAEERELAGLQEVVDRDQERVEQRHRERRDADAKDRQAREKRHASRAEGANILNGLWLGGRMAAMNWEFMQSSGVSCVVNVTADVSNYFENDTAADGRAFVYQRYAVEDSHKADLKHFFVESGAFIAQQLQSERAVLVHCREGLSRSPALLCAYLMQHASLSLKDALALLEERNGLTRINEGFMRQLVELEVELFGATSVALFDVKARAEQRSYDDMTADEKRAWDAKQAKKQRKKPLTLLQFIEFKSRQIREQRDAAPQPTDASQAASNEMNE